MTGKWARFSLLTFSSFCFFTVLFQTIAYAQVSDPSDIPTASNLKQELTPLPPTPTIYIASYLSPASYFKPTPAQSNLTEIALSQTTAAIIKTPAPTQLISTTIPTTVPEPTSTPSITTISSNGGLDPEKLFSMANAHRQSLGLPALQKDEQTCSLARSRAPEIAGEMAAGTLHSGMYGRNLPYWNTENAIAMGPEEAAFNWWLNEPVHRQAIESKTHTISCVACTGVYCVQEFTSYQQK